MATSRLVLEYDGTDLWGWSRQPGARTVQAEVERALGALLGTPGTRVPTTVAGRTDRGVHAWGQVVSYPGPTVALRALNALLPADVAVLACTPASEGFDARRDATSRTYRYRILTRPARSVFERRTSLHRPQPLDVGALHACAAAVKGTHDFTAFTPTETQHVWFARRVLRVEWLELQDVLELWIEADSFLRHMNRALVGTMLQVATGRRGLDSFHALLRGAHRREAGPTAAPHGLALAHVSYEETVARPI